MNRRFPRTKQLDRRTILRGMGTAIALPFLEAMLGRGARASEGDPPLRTAFLYVPNGIHMPAWKPDKIGENFDLKSSLQPLQEHQDSLNVLTNLAVDGARAHGDGPGDHARSAAAFLTGAHPKKTGGADIRNGLSIDQAIAQGALKGKTRFDSLELGLEGSSQSGNCDSGYSCAYPSNLAWRSATSPLAKEIDPAAIFDRLFASGDVEADNNVKDLRKSRRQSVLDYTLNDAKRLHEQLGAADRRKLDEYLYAVREIENRLVRSEKLQIGEDGTPVYARPAGVPRELTQHSKLMMDMLALAFQTDSTRVATFMFANEGSNRTHAELGVPEAHHQLSHHGKSEEKQEKIAKVNRYYVEQFAYLLDLLSSVSESDGTLLDNCLVMYGSGISDGDRHNHDDLPILLAGKAGGRLKAGNHIVYPKKTPLCNLYVWMLQQYGIPADSFGDSNDRLGSLS